MKTFTSFIIFFIAISLNAQTVYIVDNNQGSGAQYTTIQSAIDAAADGDIIYIQPSPNGYGDVNMSKTLSIYGIGHNAELNSGQRAIVSNVLFRYGNASGSKISGLIINGIYLDNTTYTNHDVVITNNRIAFINGNSNTSRANNAIIAGNYIRNPNFSAIDNYNSQNWIISNNLIEQPHTNNSWTTFNRLNSTTLLNNNVIKTVQNGDGNQSIQLFQNSSGTQISNNIFLFTGSNVANMNLGGNSGLNFQNNLTYSYNSTLDDLSGTNNLNNQDPLFTNFNSGIGLNSSSNDYNIQSGSPAEGAGTDGNDLGVFNGGFPFDIRGYPTELPYLTDFVIFNNIISAGTPLNINIKANANINN
ncbi:hypothetical protein [Winogradskyella sp.]|uniref:hypothetical protein n=2 Tax=Winogradskyella sp. TaxID=1883156 RepID=UPI0035185656